MFVSFVVKIAILVTDFIIILKNQMNMEIALLMVKFRVVIIVILK